MPAALNFKRKRITRKQKSFPTRKPDYYFVMVIGILSAFGAVMVYSGSVLVAVRQGNSPYFYFIRQVFWILLGLLGAYIVYRLDYHILPKLAIPGLAIAIVLLVAVLLVNSDQSIKRWIDLGPFDLQPSELTKLIFLTYLSGWLAKQRKRVGKGWNALKHHFTHELLPFLVLLGIISFLIIIEPDLDTTVILGATSFIVYYIAGNDRIHLLGSIFTGLALTVVVWFTTNLANYRITRLTSFFNFWQTGEINDPFGTGYQLRQILVAVASGGIFGLGFGESRQKFHYLGDTAFSDTIFAIFAEEFGLVGSIILVSVFVFILLKGYQIARRAPDRVGSLLAISMTTWITLQALLHIAANVALIPINGNTLPFISYGGSSTVINLTAMGILLNISSRSTSGSKRRSSRKR
ncbi:MAG: FtsW/RodA/SpoVE family cell cycle protein [Candidatus Dojkabacteria bacterium]